MSIRNMIYRYVQDQNTLSRGLALYQKGMVQRLDVEKSHTDAGQMHMHVSADLTGHHPEADFLDQQLTDAGCSCGEADREHLCCHLVAMLRLLSDQITPDVQLSEDKRHRMVAEVLKAYVPHTAPPVRLVPILDRDPYLRSFTLSFQLQGDERAYIIKNLTDFANRLEAGAVHRYGKWLDFRHCRQAFDEDSQFYLDLITSSVRLLGYGHHLRGWSGESRVRRYLTLTDAQFDLLFEHVCRHSGQILMKSTTDTRPVVMRQEDPPVRLAITERPDARYQLNMEADRYTLYAADRYSYLYTEDAIIRPGNSYQAHVLPLIQVMHTHHTDHLIFTENELKHFMAAALNKLEQEASVSLRMSEQLRDRLVLPDLNIHLQLDYPSSNTVRGHLIFQYGQTRINPLHPDEAYPFRNDERENAFLDLLRRYHFTPNEDEWLLTGEENLFDWLYEGLPAMMALATIDMEKRLKALKPKRAVLPRLHATMTHGLIELSFDDSLFSREELVEVLEAHRQKKQFVRLSPDNFLAIATPQVAQLDALLEDVGLRPEAVLREELTLPAFRAGHLSLLADDMGLNLALSDDLKTLARRLTAGTDAVHPLPAGLNATLRPYQKRGFDWFVNLSELHMSGILADDMGLGKTLQTIAFLLHRRSQGAQHPFLVVVPTSLIYNWEEEIRRFAPALPYLIVSGSAPERRALLEKAAAGMVLITSYAMLRRDIERYKPMTFDTIIADEAQYIKNGYTQNARALKQLNGMHRFALSGTPMENALSDIWSIMDFCMPGYLLKETAFRNVFEIPISRHDDRDRLDRLRRLMSPFLLRRVKEDVLTELPPKIETTLYANLTTEERRIYQSQLALSQKTFVESLEGTAVNQKRIQVLALLMRLRQACCSPALFLEGFHEPSSKLQLAGELITERVAAGHHLVVFSQFTSMLDLIARSLDALGLSYVTLTGKTSSLERMQLVRRFQSGEVPIFLISLKAGGVGLNLTRADTVIHFDPWWNQSVENQATDRTHRIGQKQTVHVIRLIAKDTIEEKIIQLKEKKAALSDSLVTVEQNFFKSLSEDDLRVLFDLADDEK